MSRVETAVLDDLVTFARLEVEGCDVEPWAEAIAALRDGGAVDDEGALWLTKLYNAFDDLASAWTVYRRWPSPVEWLTAVDGADAARYPCAQERRSLRGGRVLRHLDSYASRIIGTTQRRWLAAPLPASGDRFDGFRALDRQVRTVWGVGRQTAFEWCEFADKVAGLPVETPDANLWESTGPRRALQRLYGNPTPTVEWLNARANDARQMLTEAGVALSWWDFETVICDFNVMRDGRYYPGQHIGQIREEADRLADPDDRALLHSTLDLILPEPWSRLPGGVDGDARRHYRDTGQVRPPAIVRRSSAV